MSPPTPDELVLRMKADFKTFFLACQSLTVEQALMPGVCGEWSAKAVVDHLTGWQVYSLPIIDKLLAKDKTVFDLDIDTFNQNSVNERQDFPWHESLEAFEESFKAFSKRLDEIPELRFPTEKGFVNWVKAMIHEYQFHLTHIQKAQTI
jgi:hypothetical protein